MPSISNFAEAEAVLRAFHNGRVTYGVDNMRALMQYLGNPQDRLRVLHVAGTSGKTSTAYYVAALLKASGRHVGLMASPHVDRISERLQIDGEPVNETVFCSVLSEFLALLEEYGQKPSYFELLTAMAYWEFARQKVAYAVMEVGLGGLLDATNVVNRADKVCLITDIGLDHTRQLGNTISKIARQKAGIIQPGNTVYMYEQSAEVVQAVTDVVTTQHATLHLLSGQHERTDFTYLPPFQQRNIGLAIAAVNEVLARDTATSLTEDAIQHASHIRIPARLEVIAYKDKILILDGAHNQQKMTGLVAGIQKLFPHKDIAALCVMVQSSDERWRGVLDALLPHVSHILFSSFTANNTTQRSAVDPQKLMQYAQTMAPQITENSYDFEQAWQELLKRPEPVLLITGSFYLLNDVRPRIKELI